MKCIAALFILLSPLIFGLPFQKLARAENRWAQISFNYCTGFFVRLFLFTLTALPFILTRQRFSTFATVFTGFSAAACALIWLRCRPIFLPPKEGRTSGREKVYLILFLALFAVQIYEAIFLDATVMTYDDATYTTYSSDALASDTMFQIDTATGMYSSFEVRRVVQVSLLFPGYVAWLTGLSLTFVERTAGYVFYICLAYLAYLYLADRLFKKRESRLIFLCLLAALYIFGYYSHYSTTFRLLGPNTQGKAIIAVTLTPLIFALLVHYLEEGYSNLLGILLLILSGASTSLSLQGTGTVLVIIGLPIFFAMFRKERNWKHLIYFVWSGIIPSAFIAYYLYFKFKV